MRIGAEKMKSIRLQLLVTLVAVAVAAGIFIHRGLPPKTTLFHTAYHGDVEQALRSIAWGVGVNARDWVDMTLLHWAAMGGHTDVLELLVEKGADLDTQDGRGLRPVHAAALAGTGDCRQCLDSLIAKGARLSNAVADMAMRGDVAGLQRALKSIAVGSRPGTAGQSRVSGHWLWDWDGEESIDDLCTDSAGWSALHWAAAMGHEKVVELLLAKGCNVDVEDWDGGTPLCAAVRCGRKQTAMLLLSRGADIEVTALPGRHTPLMMAVLRGHSETVELLVDMGAEVNAQERHFSYVLDLALYAHCPDEVIALLRAKGAKSGGGVLHP